MTRTPYTLTITLIVNNPSCKLCMCTTMCDFVPVRTYGFYYMVHSHYFVLLQWYSTTKVPRQISSFMVPLHHTACSVTRFGVHALPNDLLRMAAHSAVALLLKQAEIIFTHCILAVINIYSARTPSPWARSRCIWCHRTMYLQIFVSSHHILVQPHKYRYRTPYRMASILFFYTNPPLPSTTYTVHAHHINRAPAVQEHCIHLTTYEYGSHTPHQPTSISLVHTVLPLS